MRRTLVLCCADAPADLLVEAYRTFGGTSTGSWLRYHRRFPAEGLLRLADDPDPKMRALSLTDPRSTSDLAERLARDPSRVVRYHAAGDPRLNAATVVGLLADPDRTMAARLLGTTQPATP